MPAIYVGAAASAASAINSIANSGVSGATGQSPAGTTTQTSAPWSAQQPYLLQGFQGAQDLYNNYRPGYFPSATVAGFTPAQQAALTGIINTAATFPNGVPQAQSYINNLVSGNYLGAPGGGEANNTLLGFERGQYLGSNPGAQNLGYFTDDRFLSNRLGGQNEAYFASGQNLDPSTNPYLKATIDNTLASVVPGITSQFTRGGSLNSPAAAFATSQGATSAISPFLFNAYQQGMQQQQQAGRDIVGQQINASTAGGQLFNTMTQQALDAAKASGGFFTDTLGKMNQGVTTLDTLGRARYTDPNAMLSAGTVQQQQGQSDINAAIAKWNYEQQLPYQVQDRYMASIGGQNYGSEKTTPYFQNSIAGLLQGLQGLKGGGGGWGSFGSGNGFNLSNPGGGSMWGNFGGGGDTIPGTGYFGTGVGGTSFAQGVGDGIYPAM